MKKFFLMLTALIFVSCSTFNVETEISQSSIKDYKKSAVLFRTGEPAYINKKEYDKALSDWIGGYNKNNKLLILDKASDKISSYDSEAARFYQMSDEEEFILNKSRGIVAAFYRNNEEELKNIFSSNDLDSLIICEIDSFFSPGLQFMSFSSVMVILDVNGNISYLDHQSDHFKISEFFPDPVKSKGFLLDKACTRIADRFLDFNYITEKE